MDKQEFWRIIDASRLAAEGHVEQQIDTLREELLALSPAAIVEFDGTFHEYDARAYHWDLWAAAYIIGGGCADDGFSDFRSWLISRGEKVFEAALANPESLLDVITEDDLDLDCQCEPIAYVAVQTWEEKTGKTFEDYPELTVDYPAEPQGEEWAEDGDELEKRFPKLCARFEFS